LIQLGIITSNLHIRLHQTTAKFSRQ